LTASAPAPKLGAGDQGGRFDLNAQGCPHPDSRQVAVIQVSGPEGAFDLCARCKLLFDEFRERWAAEDIATVEIRARMRQAGYSDDDAHQFILGLQEAA
jgi:hypothetical protein